MLKKINWGQFLTTVAAVIVASIVYDKWIAPRFDAVVPAT